MLSYLKIGARLFAGFTLVLTLCAALGAFAMSRLNEVNENTTELATNWLVAAQALGNYSDALSQMRRSEVGAVLATTRQDYNERTKTIDTDRQLAVAAWTKYTPTITPGEEQELASKVESAVSQYNTELTKTMALANDTQTHEQALAQYSSDSRKAFLEVLVAIQADEAFQARGGDRAYASAKATYSSARLQVTVMIAIAIAIGTLLAWRITASITKPLSQAMHVAERVASGDLREVHVSSSRDETGRLLQSLAAMQSSLVDVVSQVRTSSDSIATGSGQIAAGNADLSQRTEEQASNLQQTAASMEQLTSTVRQNADNAGAAMRLVEEATLAASSSRDTVASVVATMSQIEEASRKVGDIIGVIDGIAFQTNILALNAAVEAARAGDHGRGFAVVASEVRALAQRSATAAKEVKALVSTSTQRVEIGVAQVHDAGEAIGGIATKVAKVNALMNEITAASNEQSVGIGQVGDAVSQLDQVTQQNAALVEESAAAAESLKQQADRLASTMSFFKL